MDTIAVVSNVASGRAGRQARETIPDPPRDKLIARGAEVSEAFHDGTRGADFHHDGWVSGPDRGPGTCCSCAPSRDPDGSG